MPRRQKKASLPFASLLPQLMKKKSIRVTEAARIGGVSASTIVDWCNGTVPNDLRAVKRLAEAFGTSLSFLLLGEHEKANGNGNGHRSVTEVFVEKEVLYDGYAKIRIQALEPRRAVSQPVEGAPQETARRETKRDS